MSLAQALEAAATALPAVADDIRPANGDPLRLLALLGNDVAPRVLAWLLEHRPEEGAELAEAWSAEAEGARFVLAVSESGLPKAGRKALRRVRHRLRSQGFAEPEATPAPLVATLPAVPDAFSAAYVSPLDSAGRRIVYLLEPNPGGGGRLFEVVIDDGQGVIGFEVYTAARKQVRALLADLKARERFPVTEVSPDTARAVVAHAAAHQPGDRPPPSGFSEWRGRVAAAPEDARLPGELAREALGEPEGREHLDRAAELVSQGRVGPWPPGAEVLAALFERIRTALESPVIVSGAAKREQIERLLGEAQEEIFAREGAALAAHRFRESAFVLWRGGDEAAARACLAAAAAFEARRPADNPVARALLAVPLAPALQALEAPKGDEARPREPGSLLVEP